MCAAATRRVVFQTSTFYATAGIWNTTESSGATGDFRFGQMTSRLAATRAGPLFADAAAKNTKAGDADVAGWWGQVLKTSDGGATWSVVLESIDEVGGCDDTRVSHPEDRSDVWPLREWKTVVYRTTVVS